MNLSRVVLICITLLVTFSEAGHTQSSDMEKICEVAQKIVNQVTTGCTMEEKVERIDCGLLFTRTGLSAIGKDSLKDPEAKIAWARISRALIEWAERGCPKADLDSVVRNDIIPPCKKLDTPQGQ